MMDSSELKFQIGDFLYIASLAAKE